VRNEQQRVLDLMGDLEKKMDNRGQDLVEELRGELQRVISERNQKYDSNYGKLLELLVESEKKTDQKYDQQFQELKAALEKLMQGRLGENQKAFDQKH